MSTPKADSEATARIDSDAARTPYPRGAQEQFAPGTVVAGRYRIAGILGAGGMGEVYRADDVKLGQPVALKFLPARLARDPILLARLHDEVRLGRQVAHPNVCRIYDIVDWDGAQFVAMEFVDGEDLSRLLRRIGRLAHDKAVDIARGIAAGLQAAHAKGILHRDLKPANVMIDSHGEARIMDFGLALAAGEHDGTISGTPAYMAPEQLDGRPATIQSDLYALGLVLYELFTGRRAHTSRTVPDRLRELSGNITTPSSVVRDIDPAVERIILRCLADDPARRPRSAREVIEALPGGDPLAAAMAAGETPSPRLVAAAGAEGSIRPAVAWSLLAAVLLLLAATVVIRAKTGLLRLARVTRPPAAMADRAETVLRELGLPPAGYRAYGYEPANRYLSWIFATDPSPARWKRVERGLPAVFFWLRDEPQPLLDRESQIPAAASDAPPLTRPGAKLIELDPRGRLVALKAVPEESWKPRELDWKPLLAAGGFADAALRPAEPQGLPPFFADARAAWATRHPDDGTPIRIEAAAWRGTPVFFRIAAPWDEAPDATGALPFGRMFSSALTIAFLLVALVGAVLAWRNIRLRRGDRQGAFRVAAAMAVTSALGVLLTADHALAFDHERALVTRAAEVGLLLGALFWLIYVALEPFLRRRWPDRLISWSRLLAGDWRSPMIGRDILVGITAGIAHVALAMTSGVFVINDFSLGNVHPLDSTAAALGHLIASASDGLTGGLMLMTALMTFSLVLRRRPLAIAALALTLFALFLTASTAPGMWVFHAVIAFLYTFVPARFGLLAAVAMHGTFTMVLLYPVADAIAWYTAIGLVPVFAVVILAVVAFRIALGGQSPFSPVLFDE